VAAAVNAIDIIPVSSFNGITVIVLHPRSKNISYDSHLSCITEMSVCYHFIQYFAI